MDKNELDLLAKRYLQGIATDEEKQRLHAWYDAWQDDELQVTLPHNMDEQALQQLILARVLQSANPVADKQRKNKTRYWLAAAAVLALASLSFLWIYNSSKTATPASAQTPPVIRDAAPGTDKAILTLSNGSKVVLDSATNGKLATEGNSTISREKQGSIVYSSAGFAPQQTLYNTVTTPRGGQYKVELSDGTKVWLNAASSLTYPTSFTGTSREVTLTGEAYFEVASIVLSNDRRVPFTVNVKNMNVQVLGTEFNVNAYDDEETIKTTLLKGSVNIDGEGIAPLQLQPSQQSVYDKKGTVTLVKDADTEAAVAWKNGLFKFSSTDLSTIMRQAARWYDVDVDYSGNVKEETFSGDIPRAQYASEFFKVLELTKTVQFTIENKKVMIAPYKK